MGAILELEGIVKRYDGTPALEHASLRLEQGTVHALLGENGAGKTTLMRIAYGMTRPDAGRVRIRGADVRLRSPADALRRGVGMVHQHFTLVSAMTVAEHVALARRGSWRHSADAQYARDVSARTGLALDPDRLAGDLDVAAQQRLEILKALAAGGEILILDEPTAVLMPAESEELLAWIGRFRAQGGSVVLITHKLREALAVADTITVLRRGRVTLAGPRARYTAEAIVTAMLGHAVAPEPPPDATPRSVGAAVVAASGLELRDPVSGTVRVRDASFEIRAGEIVGIAAVEGSGHRELLRALAGRLLPAGGTLHLPDTVGFIPADRQREALVLEMDLVENVALRGAARRRGRMPWTRLEDTVRELVDHYAIRPPTLRARAGTLSGGNQQKLVLARELADRPPLLVAENPTRGLDVQATAGVAARLREARAAGAALVVYASDLDEMLPLADRVLVVYAGTVRELPPDRELVGRAMLGVA